MNLEFGIYNFRQRIPADPVSIAIALRAAQKSTINEDQLVYGFKKQPINQLPRAKIYPNIPEERLFQLNSKVIEFQLPNDSEEDEFKIDDGDEEFTVDTKKTQSQSHDFEKTCLSYSDIGYAETNGKYPKFEDIPISTTPNPYIAPTINPNCNGRIIDLPKEKYYDNDFDQFLAEYLEQHCEPKEAFSR